MQGLFQVDNSKRGADHRVITINRANTAPPTVEPMVAANSSGCHQGISNWVTIGIKEDEQNEL